MNENTKENSVFELGNALKCSQVSAVLLAIGMTWGVAQAQQAPIRVGVTRQADTRIVIAAPAFASDASTTQYARELSKVIERDLDFSGLFKIVMAPEYPSRFRGFTNDVQSINFNDWRGTPAEFLIHAYVFERDGRLFAQCRLFDVLVASQTLGTELNAQPKAWRQLGHRFADEVVRYLTGVRGVGSSEIVFSAGRPGKKEIYVVDYDGENLTQITKHNSISVTPQLSPDSNRIAYMSFKDRYPFLYILDRGAGRLTPFSKRIGLNHAPAWAPDGRTLALCLSRDGNTEIYTKNMDGSNERRITNDRASDTSPTFAPDGRRIAFVSDRVGRPNIFVMDINGRNIQRLSFQGGNAYDPAWSPDGKSIAYVVEKSGEGLEIWVMNHDGGNAHRITNSGGSNESPSWSPDSRHLVFASSRTGNWQLHTATLETGAIRKIPGLAKFRTEGPSWGLRRGS
jgi:TolB protein